MILRCLVVILLLAAMPVAAEDRVEVDVDLPDIANPAIAADIQAVVRSREAAFRELATENLKVLPEGFTATFDVTSHAGHAPAGLGSWLLEISAFAGGAHPSHEIVTRTYDLTSGQRLTFDDLFIDGARKVLAERARTRLAETLGADADSLWIAEGTAPEPDNWDSFVLERDAVVFWFQEYQVAAYVFGPQHLAVSYESIAELLRPTLAQRLSGD